MDGPVRPPPNADADAPRPGLPPGPRGPLPELLAWGGRHRFWAVAVATALGFLVLALWRHLERRDLAVRHLEHERAGLLADLQRSEFLRRREEGGTLLALSNLERDRDPALALHLAVRAARLRPGPTATDTLAQVLDRHHEMRRFYAHDGPVLGFDLDADARNVLTWDRTGLVLVGDLESGEVVGRHVVPRRGVRATRWLEPGRFAVLTRDGRLERVSLASEGDVRVETVNVGEAPPTAMARIAAGLVLARADGALLLVEAGEALVADRQLLHHDAPILALSAREDGSAFASLDAAGMVRRFDGQTGRLAWEGRIEDPLPSPPFPLRPRLAWVGDDGALAVGTPKGRVRVYRADHEFLDLGSPDVSCVGWAASEASDRLVACFQPRDPTRRGPTVVMVHDVGTGEFPARFVGLPRARGEVRMAVYGDGAAWARSDGTVTVRDVTTGQERARLAGHEGPVGGLAFLREGDALFTIGADRTARLWDARPPEVASGDDEIPAAWDAGRWRVAGEAPTARDPNALWMPAEVGEGAVVAQGSDGRQVAVADADGRVRVFVRDGGEERVRHEVVLGPCRAMGLDAAGHLVHLALDGSLVRVTLETGSRLAASAKAPTDAFAVAVTADGSRVLVASPDGLEIRSGDDLSVEVRRRFEEAVVADVAVAPDGKAAVLHAEDGRVLSWPFDLVEVALERLPSPMHPQDMIRLEIGDPRAIYEVGDRYVDRQPCAKDCYGLGRGRLQSGLLEEASARFEQAEKLRPDLALGAYGLALVATQRMAASLPGTEEHALALRDASANLRRALASGGVPRGELMSDPLLAPLRDRAEFDEILGASGYAGDEEDSD